MAERTYEIVALATGGLIERTPVTGEAVGEYLAIRKSLDGYVLDNIPTGLRVGTWPTIEAARVVAQSLAEIVDWSLVGDDAEANKAVVSEPVRAYIRKISGHARAWPFGGAEPVPPKVTISLELRAELTVDDLWPDGDWPDEITAEAVQKLIEKAGGDAEAIRDWNLAEGGLEITINGGGR